MVDEIVIGAQFPKYKFYREFDFPLRVEKSYMNEDSYITCHVFMRWDGMVATLRPLLTELRERMRGKEDMRLGMLIWSDYFLHQLLPRQKSTQVALSMLEALTDRFQAHQFTVPRLDMAVIHGLLGVLVGTIHKSVKRKDTEF
jgi:hypothetical protein